MEDDFKKYKNLYYALGPFVCPVLNNEKVYFNNHGFNHLIRKRGIKRYSWDSKRRFKLLKYVKIIIESSDVQIEYRKTKQEFWALIKVINKRKIKIVLKRMPGGRIHFYSIFDEK